MNIPHNCQTIICSSLSLSDLASLQIADVFYNEVIEFAKEALQNDWEEWLKNNPTPIKKMDKSTKQKTQSIDNHIKFCVLNNEKVIECKRLHNRERFYVHTRAEQLGLKSISIGDTHVKDMLLEKPEDWTFDKNSTSTRKPYISKIQDKQRLWKGHCDHCGKDLDVSSALYHWSGLGPLCTKCVDNDDELNGLKWETMYDIM